MLICSFGAAALVVALAGYAYWRGIRNDTPIEKFSEVILEPEGEKRLGTNIEAYALFKCPWHRFPVEAVAAPGKGSQQTGKPRIELFKIRYGYCIWKVRANIQPYRTGDIPKGTLDVIFNEGSGKSGDTNIALKIPAFKAMPLNVDKSKELALASRIEKESQTSSWAFTIITATIVLVIFILALFFIFRRKKGEARIILTPWGIAFCELSELRAQLKNGKLPSPVCFSKLTDIVRNYLEKRFTLPAPQQTTYEFLHDLNKTKSPLAENHRHFLKEFMTSADLVKFANLPADTSSLEDAMDKAEKLVTETKPEVNEKK